MIDAGTYLDVFGDITTSFYRNRIEGIKKPERSTVDFSDYARTLNRGEINLMDYEHAPRLASVCQRIIDKKLKRVIISMAPRYYKTEFFGRLLTGAYLKAWPTEHVGIISHSAKQAWRVSGEAKAYYMESGGAVSYSSKAKNEWHVMHGGREAGGCWAYGTGAIIIGKGFNLGIIDDPQDMRHALSPLFQRNWSDWYPGGFVSRGEPGNAIVLVMQRLGPSDAVDYMFEHEEVEPQNWHVVICDEIKSNENLWRGHGEQGLPETCTLEPDDRKVGELLAPSRIGREEVESIHRMDPFTTKAQRQQRPSALTGNFWQREWFDVYDELPEDAYNGGDDWDTAYTKSDLNAASAKVRSFRGAAPKDDPKNFFIYIEDVDWDWLEFDALAGWMRGSTGPAYIEDKASGKSLHQHLQKVNIKTKLVSVVGGDKLARSSGVQPIVSQGRVKIKREVYDRLLQGKHHKTQCNGRQGLLAITAEALAASSGDLDVNDAFVQAVNRHVLGTKTGVKTYHHAI